MKVLIPIKGEMPTRRYALRDDRMERIKDMLPDRPGYVGGTAKDNRLFVDTVLYRYRSGILWRDLPARPIIHSSRAAQLTKRS